MKRNLFYRIIGFSLIAILLTSCEWFNDLIDFSFTTGYKEIPFSVDPSSAGEYTFIEKVLKSDIEAEVEENGGDIGNLKDIKIEEARLEMLTPSQNLDAFDKIEVFIKSANHPEILLASAENIANGLLMVNLTLTEESLKEFLEEDEYTIKVKGILSEDVTTKLDLVVKIKYKVEVGA